MLNIGDKAPEFALTDKDGETHRLGTLDEYVVVYFYPKDDTPGCTVEAKEFSADTGKFSKEGVSVVGISGGDDKTKTKFVDKFGLKVLLLSDPEFSTCKDYGVYGKKKFMGREFLGINRITYILHKGKVIHVFPKVKPEGHSAEVLAIIKEHKG